MLTRRLQPTRVHVLAEVGGIPVQPILMAPLSCDTSLTLVKWLIDDDTLTESYHHGGIVRPQEIPFIREAAMAALNDIRCDGETLLITLPTVWTLTKGIQTFAYVTVTFGAVAIAALFAFMIRQRGTTVFRSASVPSMSLILCGLALLFAGSLALVSTPSTSSCAAVMWLGSLGFTLTFAPLFMKTWRIYRIFDRKQLHVVKISNKK